MNEPGKIMLLFLVAIMFTVQAVAQNLSVSGLVQDGTTGEGVIGANVVIKGTTNGTITDLDGKFKLQAKQGDIIVISFIGYKTQELPAMILFIMRAPSKSCAMTIGVFKSSFIAS